MFGSTALEVAIGLILIYLVLSLICTVINEWISGILNMRATMLKRGVCNLLNDPAFVEAARGLACRTLREGGPDAASRLTFAFRLCVSRAPKPEEMSVLLRVYEHQLDHYRQDKAAAAKLVAIGESPRPPDLDVSELAAWTAVGNILLNLDETITKG